MRALIDFVRLDLKEVEDRDLQVLWVALRSSMGMVIWLASTYIQV